MEKLATWKSIQRKNMKRRLVVRARNLHRFKMTYVPSVPIYNRTTGKTQIMPIAQFHALVALMNARRKAKNEKEDQKDV